MNHRRAARGYGGNRLTAGTLEFAGGRGVLRVRLGYDRERGCDFFSHRVLERMKAGVLFLGLLLVLCCAGGASAVPTYSIVPLGLDDPEHTRNDGYEYSDTQSTRPLNEAGQVIGSSVRYNGGNTSLGSSAWLYEGAMTIDIGLTGVEHTRDDGYRFSNAAELNDAGQVRGSSARYNGGSTDLGESAWLYDGATTIEIGFIDNEYTRSDDYKFSKALQLNAAGQIRGYSNRYNGSIDLGPSAWLQEGTTTINVGLVDGEHTNGYGYKYSVSSALNEAGQVIGFSSRFDGGGSPGDNGGPLVYSKGNSAWLYDGESTIRIGLFGSEHTRSDDNKISNPLQLNNAGQVIGTSRRYNGGPNLLGESAWFYNGTETIEIGLTGGDYTFANGTKSSKARHLNENGQVAGWSSRVNGGLSSWFFDGTTTTEIGLTDAEHTSSGGERKNAVSFLSESGNVVGSAWRYNGGNSLLGYSTWLYDGDNSFEMGLTGSEYTRNDGYMETLATQVNDAGQVLGYSVEYGGGTSSGRAWLYDGTATRSIGLTGGIYAHISGLSPTQATDLNESGQVVGHSFRFNGNTRLGQDAWFYDPEHDQTVSLNLSTRSDGYAFSRARYLGDDGLVLGTYTLFDTDDAIAGERVFYFTLPDGLHDIGSLVDGGLDGQGWVSLAEVIRANTRGQILGYGDLASPAGNGLPYLLTPIVPEPSAGMLCLLGVIGGCGARRYKRLACTG